MPFANMAGRAAEPLVAQLRRVVVVALIAGTGVKASLGGAENRELFGQRIVTTLATL